MHTLFIPMPRVARTAKHPMRMAPSYRPNWFAQNSGVDVRANNPAVNIRQGEEAWWLELAAPGLDKADFDIREEGGHLIVSVDKQGGEQPNYKRREFGYQRFERRFRLAEGLDPADITASYEAGILRLRIGLKRPDSQHIQVL